MKKWLRPVKQKTDVTGFYVTAGSFSRIFLQRSLFPFLEASSAWNIDGTKQKLFSKKTG